LRNKKSKMVYRLKTRTNKQRLLLRIIHTSDWHLGQRFFGESREEEHQRFLDWLINEIKFKILML